jgi:prostaglandin-E synthase
MQGTTAPHVKWAQRKDRLFLTIDAVNVKNPTIDIVDGKTLKFRYNFINNHSGSTDEHKYAFEIELWDEVSKEESKYSFEGRNIFLNIKKKTKAPYWPRLTKQETKLNWLAPDWGYYVDEDEEDEDTNMPKFGNEQNFGFGGGDDEMPDDEDDLPTDKAGLNDLDQDA